MSRSSVDGPEGSGGGAEDFPPAAEPREPAEDAAAGPPAEREVRTSRAVMVGEARESEPAVELTEEHDEESAAPLIDDASPVEDWPEDISAPGLRHQPSPSSTLWTKPIVPTLAPNRPRSEPPPDAAYLATSMSAPVFPVPPPFVPFPDAMPFDAAKTARRPAVAPPPPPPGETPLPVAFPPPLPAAAASPVSPPAAHVPSAQPPRPSPQPSTPPPAGLPKVMISEEAYRPSQAPPVSMPPKPSSLPPPAVPATPPGPAAPRLPSLRDTPAFGVMPEPGMRTSPPFGTASVPQPGTRTSPPFGTYVTVASAPPPPRPPAAMADLLQPSSASEPPMEVPADAALEDGDEEETAAPLVGDMPEDDEAAAGELPRELVIDDAAGSDEAEEVSVQEVDEEPSESGTAAPAMDDAGLFPAEEAQGKPSSVEDVFAPPTAAGRRFALQSEDEAQERPEVESSLVDALASVISIPEDDVPRAPSAAQASPLPVQPATPPALHAAGVTVVPPRPPPAKGKGAQQVEELAETDVQAIEGDEGPAGEAAPVAGPARPRPGAAQARPSRPRRRRRHGERRPWWEEIFDEEYIRSLPKYTPDQTRREVDYLERALGVAKTARILDVGCGEGRHAVELALRGYEVVGLDLAIAMLARAGEAAQAKSVKINFIQGDMRDMRFDAAFDAIYCVGTTFGYFDDDANAAVLAGMFRALKPGGRMLLAMCNRDHVLLNQPRSTWFQGDDRQYLEDTDFNYITSRLVVKRSWATSSGDQEAVEYSVRLYALHEMGRILHTAGFKVTEVSGNAATPGVFFGADSATLLLLAEKP